MAQIIAEDCSTTADVSSSIFLYKDNSAKSSCRIEVEDEPSSTVFIEDIDEDVYFEEDDVFHSPPSLPYSSESKANTVIAAEKQGQLVLDPLAQTYKVRGSQSTLEEFLE